MPESTTESGFITPRKLTATRSAILLTLLLVLPAAAARAEEPAAAPAAAPAAPPPAAPPAAPPAGLPPSPPPGTPSAVEAATKPPTAAETMPASRPEVLPPIDVGAWVRAGSVFQSATDPKSLGDWHMDTSYIELHAGGKIHKNVGLTLNVNANLLAGTVAIEDAIIQLDFMDQFHLWAGQLLVPVDRSNAAGPFFMIPWNFPGFLTVGNTTVVAAPAEGPSGRNTGAVVWGDISQFKYMLGVFDNGNVNTSPLYSGRVSYAFIGKEPGFWGNASYFGDQDVLALIVGGQFQKNGASFVDAAMVNHQANYGDFNLDLLAEFKTGGGWVTGEGAYYHFAVSDANPTAVKDTFFLLGAYASPVVGYGNIQPMVRYQWANTVGLPGAETTKAWNLDIGVAYLIKGPALRLIATYGHTSIPDMTGSPITANAVQLSAQGIFF